MEMLSYEIDQIYLLFTLYYQGIEDDRNGNSTNFFLYAYKVVYPYLKWNSC